MKPTRSIVVLAFALLAAAGSPACGPSTPSARMAHVQVGTLPPGATFRGQWYTESFGTMHLVPDGNTAVARWKDERHSRVGKLSGTITGDVIKFTWEERTAGVIGPSAIRKGKGYFKYIPQEEPNLPRLKGEIGLGENEVGSGEMELAFLKDKAPDLGSVKSEEDPTVDTGWDAPAAGTPATPPKKLSGRRPEAFPLRSGRVPWRAAPARAHGQVRAVEGLFIRAAYHVISQAKRRARSYLPPPLVSRRGPGHYRTISRRKRGGERGLW
jgi:hypothetical protein